MSRADLSQAIKANRLSQVLRLLDASPDLLEALTLNSAAVRFSPFVESIIYSRLDIATFLVSRGADVHRRFDSREEQGFTVAHWAVLNFKSEVMRYLLELGVDFRATTSKQTSPLTRSAAIENTASLRFLLEELGFDARMKSFQGDSLLHVSAYSGRLQTCLYLIRAHGLDLYEENDYHLTPAFKAAAGSVELLTALSEMGVDYCKMVNGHHNSLNYALWTPLHYACERGNIDTFNYLAKQLKLDVEARTYYRSNCLLIAAGSSLDMVKLLISEYRQDPFAVNDFGENAAFIAAKHGKVDVIEYLWHTTGVDVTRRNRDELTILDAIKGKKWEEEAKTVICAIQKAIFAKRKPILAARLQLIRLKLH